MIFLFNLTSTGPGTLSPSTDSLYSAKPQEILLQLRSHRCRGCCQHQSSLRCCPPWCCRGCCLPCPWCCRGYSWIPLWLEPTGEKQGELWPLSSFQRYLKMFAAHRAHRAFSVKRKMSSLALWWVSGFSTVLWKCTVMLIGGCWLTILSKVLRFTSVKLYCLAWYRFSLKLDPSHLL